MQFVIVQERPAPVYHNVLGFYESRADVDRQLAWLKGQFNDMTFHVYELRETVRLQAGT